MSIHCYPNQVEDVRLGITASRKVGKAVVRHLLKRRVREIFRRSRRREGLMPSDVVVHLKPTAARADFVALASEMERLLAALAPRSEPGP